MSVAPGEDENQNTKVARWSVRYPKHSPAWDLFDQAASDWGRTWRCVTLLVVPVIPVLCTLVLLRGSLVTVMPWVAGIGTVMGVGRYARRRISRSR
jgi:hypothetical protein